LGFEGGAWRRSKRRRSKLARTGAVFLAVAAAEGVLVGVLDLTGSAIRTSRTADEIVPYYFTTERTPQPKPKDLAAEQRPPRKRKPAASPPPGLPSPAAPSVSPPTPAAPPQAAAAPPAPDYGRWTVAPGAWPETGRGRIVTTVCDSANLASLPADVRKACVETLKSAAAGPPARRGAAQDWKSHNPISCEPKNEPGHKLLLDHCSPVGGTTVGFTLKYKF
jgi:hypothetical protein